MITLQVNGRERTFSEEELTVILEKHFSSEAANQANAVEVAERPTEGKWFKVNPLAIDQQLFKKERSDSRQEETRKLILEAFEEMKNNPKYARSFKTMIPKKTWEIKNVGELKELPVYWETTMRIGLNRLLSGLKELQMERHGKLFVMNGTLLTGIGW